MSTRWAEPTRALSSDEQPLSVEQIHSWREKGFALVDGLIPVELIEAGVSTLDSAFGTTPPEGGGDFGSLGAKWEFPTESAACNDITLHPRLLNAVSQLLGTDDIRLTQSDVWPKWGRAESVGPRDNHEQRVHCDYPNHTLTHPSPWETPDVVEIILYYDDVDKAGGPTGLVAREGSDDEAYQWPFSNMPGFGALPWINDKTSAEAYLAEHAPEVHAFRAKLYEREAFARYRRGTVLLYRHDTWHRGTCVTPGRLRRVHNMTFRRADADWIPSWNAGWPRRMYRADMLVERLVAAASVQQRSALGFPRPGHRYWSDKTLQAVAMRYAPFGMDMEPYARALGARNAAVDTSDANGPAPAERYSESKAEILPGNCAEPQKKRLLATEEVLRADNERLLAELAAVRRVIQWRNHEHLIANFPPQEREFALGKQEQQAACKTSDALLMGAQAGRPMAAAGGSDSMFH